MIVEFNFSVTLFDDIAVVAVMFDEPPITVGIFEDYEDAELACHRFKIEHDRKLN
jgi:hypothetical protein